MSSEDVNVRKRKSEDVLDDILPSGWEKRLSRNSSIFFY